MSNLSIFLLVTPLHVQLQILLRNTFPDRPCTTQEDHAQALQSVQCLEEALKQEGSEMHEADSNEELARRRCEMLQQELSTLEEDLSKTSVAEEQYHVLLEEVCTRWSHIC